MRLTGASVFEERECEREGGGSYWVVKWAGRDREDSYLTADYQLQIKYSANYFCMCAFIAQSRSL